MKRLLVTFATALLFGAVVLQPVVPAAQAEPQASVNCNAMPASLSDPNIATMWTQIQQARAMFPSPPPAPLIWSDTLSQSATWMAYDASRRVGNSDPTYPSLTDSLGRDTRTRLTDCGYRSDAGVSSSVLKVVTSNPSGAFNVWLGYNNLQLYRLIHDPALKVAGLGLVTAPMSFYPYWWAIDAGTLPDASAPQPTAVPPTATPVPPTAIPPTAVPPTPVPTKVRVHYLNCTIDAGSWPGPTSFSCDE